MRRSDSFARIRRGYPGSLVLVSTVLVLSGCHGSVDSISAHVGTSGGQQRTIRFRDLDRRPPEEELRLEPALSDEYAIAVRDDTDTDGADAIVFGVEGSTADGTVTIARDDHAETVRFDQLYRETEYLTPDRNNGSRRYEFALPPWGVEEGTIREDTSITFRRGTGSYRVVSIDLIQRSVEPVVLFGNDTARFDDRIPVTVSGDRWIIRDLDSELDDPIDAMAITYEIDHREYTDRTNPPSATIYCDDRAVRFQPLPGRRTLIIRPVLWGASGETFEIAPRIPSFRIVGVTVVRAPTHPTEPIPIELAELDIYPRELWRGSDFEVFSWASYPGILWIDSVDYEVQSAFFKRLAFFVEKRGFTGTLVDDQTLSGRYGYNAHNYRPEGLSAFYNAVEGEDFPINRYEVFLRDLLSSRGVIVRDDGRWISGSGGVLSISQESYPALRRFLITHEAMHGVFSEVPPFRDGVIEYWRNELSERERQYFRDAFAWMGYEPSDEYLMNNEFQAYVLQQQEAAVPWYFRSRLADRARGSRGRTEPVDRFLQDHPSTFRNAGAAMNRLLFETSGMVGGDPFSLAPVDGEQP